MGNPILVTGSASGLGAAVKKRLEAAGRTVIGVDRHDADVVADLATTAGRTAVTAAVTDAGGVLDGVVSCAALAPNHPDPAAVVRVNAFGAIAVLDGCLDALKAGEAPAAVVISSIGAAIGGSPDLLAAIDAGDEDAAAAAAPDSITAYSTAKAFVALGVRRRTAAWGAAGVRLNAVAPGAMETPMLDGLLADPTVAPGIRAMPSAMRFSASADDIAGAVVFLLGPDANFVHGQVLYVDGGTEALVRPDRY